MGSVSSGSGDNMSSTDGGNGANGGIAGSVGGKGVFQSFRESLFSRAAPEVASPPAPAQKSSGTGSGIMSSIGTGISISTNSGSGSGGAQETAVVSSTPDENRRKLRSLIERVKLEMKPFQLEEALGGFEGVAAHCRVLCGALVGFEVKRREELRAKIRGSGAPGSESEGAGVVGELIGQEELVKTLEKAPGLMEVREWRQTVAALRDELSGIMNQGFGPVSFGLEARAPASAGVDHVGLSLFCPLWMVRADECRGPISSERVVSRRSLDISRSCSSSPLRTSPQQYKSPTSREGAAMRRRSLISRIRTTPRRRTLTSPSAETPSWSSPSLTSPTIPAALPTPSRARSPSAYPPTSSPKHLLPSPTSSLRTTPRLPDAAPRPRADTAPRPTAWGLCAPVRSGPSRSFSMRHTRTRTASRAPSPSRSSSL